MTRMVSWLCFMEFGCLCGFMGRMWGVVGASSLCCIGQSLVKDQGSTPSQVISVFKFV
jgi:hypothetical protein